MDEDIMLHDFDEDEPTYQDEWHDDIDDEDEEYYEVNRETYMKLMQSVSRHAWGISFVLLMEHSVQGHSIYDTERKDYSIHPRFDQPCQGGETRKYESHNPGDCTQPHNGKPTDLYHPFPSGRPSAISFPLMKKPKAEDDVFFRSMITKDSPWLKGFGYVDNVEFLVDDNNLAYGYTIGVDNLDVDPTVMINMINTIKTIRGAKHEIPRLMNLGLTHWEAVAVLMLNGNSTSCIADTGTYYFPCVFSAKRFFGQRPNDLSGGFYSDRTDYNRTYIADVFLGDLEENCEEWSEGMKRILKLTGYTPKVTIEKLAEGAKEWFADRLANEEITDKPYVYRDAYGNEKETPIILSQQPVVKEAA